MSLFTTLKLALRALWRNKVRTLLTMLGIIFGIGAVIAMVAGGQGARDKINQTFQAMGTNVLYVRNGSQAAFGAAGGLGSRMSLTWGDLAALQSGEVATIGQVVALLQTKAQVASEEQNWNTQVYGTTAAWFQIRNWGAVKGRVFDLDTGESDAKVAVIGTTVATQLFAGSDPVGQTIRIQNQPYEVIGVLESKGAGPMGDNDDLVVIPLKTYLAKLSKGLAKYVNGTLAVSMKEDGVADVTMQKIQALLRDRHKLDASQDDDFQIRNPSEWAKGQQDSVDRINMLLKIVAAISLLVGGIGVMNIMLVSVIERTREIGIRMAVGAKPNDVMMQFLVEALVLAIIGGGLGLPAGWGGAKALAHYFEWKMFFPAQTAAVAVAVAGGVGVAFGLYPAIRASRLDPITALRYET